MTGRAQLLMGVMAVLAGAGAGCGNQPPCGLQLCDIRLPGCQQVVAGATACLRQVSPVAVPINVVAREDYLREQTDVVLSVEDEERFRSQNAVLALWGLAPPDLSPSESARADASAVAAFYSLADKQITIVDDGFPLDSDYLVEILVHESTHAIQDATVDLTSWFQQHAPDSDRALALGAVVEGEATKVEDLAIIALFGDDASEISWGGVYRGWQERARQRARESSLPVQLANFHFEYPFGTQLVHDAVAAGGWAGADALYVTPPHSEREVLAGFAASEPLGGPWAEDLVDDAVPILPDRFSFRTADRMGAWVVGVWLERAGLPFARQAAEGLRGDTLSVFRDDLTLGVVGFWRLRFSSVALAETVRGVVGSWPNQSARLLDRDVVLSIASDDNVAREIPDNLDYQPIPPSTAPSPANGLGPAGRVRCTRPARW